MTLITPQFIRRMEGRRMWPTCRRVTATVGIFLLLSQTINADPIRIAQIIQSVNTAQRSIDLKVNNLAQDPVVSGVRGSTDGEANKSKRANSTTTPDSSLAGVEVNSQSQQIGVEVVGDAIVEGTVCDCGEILVPGGFPKWPLLFLAAIPLIFIHDCNDCDNECVICDVVVTPTPTPTPPNSTVPEPATLLLFGSGLLAFGAGLRRRYAKAKLAGDIKTNHE